MYQFTLLLFTRRAHSRVKSCRRSCSATRCSCVPPPPTPPHRCRHSASASSRYPPPVPSPPSTSKSSAASSPAGTASRASPRPPPTCCSSSRSRVPHLSAPHSRHGVSVRDDGVLTLCSPRSLQRCQSREAAEAVSEVVAAFPGSSVSPTPLIFSMYSRNATVALFCSLSVTIYIYQSMCMYDVWHCRSGRRRRWNAQVSWSRKPLGASCAP